LKQKDGVSILETVCGFNNNASVIFKDNNTLAKYIDSYVEGIMYYNFISHLNDTNDDYAMTRMIRQILLQDERIKGNSIFFYRFWSLSDNIIGYSDNCKVYTNFIFYLPSGKGESKTNYTASEKEILRWIFTSRVERYQSLRDRQHNVYFHAGENTIHGCFRSEIRIINPKKDIPDPKTCI
jgi:hypothetical protein